VDGEVPVSYPTILQQCDSFTDSPDTVDFLILNGGINDVDIRTILNPLTDGDDLKEMIDQYCYRDMVTLLRRVTAKFSNPAAKIVVTSYYPILSRQSDPIRLPRFLGVHGVVIGEILTLVNGLVFGKIMDQCQLFSDRSAVNLQKAVAEINQNEGATRVVFALVPFGPENAALAPNAWLWGIGDDLSPQDPVRAARHLACDRFEPDPIQRETCYRASAGHPNIEGAQQFANAILAKV
jgi:hypothetical protein